MHRHCEMFWNQQSIQNNRKTHVSRFDLINFFSVSSDISRIISENLHICTLLVLQNDIKLQVYKVVRTIASEENCHPDNCAQGKLPIGQLPPA